MGDYVARVNEEFAVNRVSITLGRRVDSGLSLYKHDGKFEIFQEGISVVPEVVLCVVPLDALACLYATIGKFLGEIIPSAIESKVLREVLNKEQARVDLMLGTVVDNQKRSE